VTRVLKSVDAGAGAHSSLDLTHQMVTALPPMTCKYRRPRWVIDAATRDVWQERCRRNTCDYCRPLNAKRRAAGIALAGPERTIVVTLAADAGDATPLATARIRVKRLRHKLRVWGVEPGEWTWTLERNPGETGFHAHALQHGPYVPQARLQDASEAAGAGFAYIERLRADSGRAAAYGLKGFASASYGMKSMRSGHDGRVALEVNAGRLEHHTPGFYRHEQSPIGVRRAEAIAISKMYPDRNDRYFVATTEQALLLLSDNATVSIEDMGRIIDRDKLDFSPDWYRR